MPIIEEIFDEPVVSSPSPRSSSSPPSEASLQALLTRLGASSTSLALLSPDVLLLISTFTHNIPPRARSLGFLVLAQLASNDGKQLAELFAPTLEDLLIQTKSQELEKALSFLSALLQSAQPAGIAIILRPGFLDNLFDLTDLYPTSTGDGIIPLALADLISQASNTKQGRTALSSAAWIAWLEKQTSGTTDAALRATAAVALTKLSRGGGSAEDALAAAQGEGGAEEVEEDESEKGKRDLNLARMMKDIVVASSSTAPSTPPSPAVVSAVEGLAFTSLRGLIKELLASDKTFLARLFALIPPPPTSRSFANPISVADAPPPPSSSSSTTPPSLAYGIAAILSNLTSYRPQLTAEQIQLDRLRRMTTAAKQAKTPRGMEVPDEDPLDDDRHVRMRVKKVLEAGAVPVLVSLGRSDSRAVRDVVGRCFLSLVEVRDDRGLIIQQGGAKALLAIIYNAIALPSSASKPKPKQPPSEAPAVPSTLLPALQALAKLTITTSPFALYGPNPSSSADAIRPLALLLLHSDASLLQQFEALMALTNLASLGPELADRIATVEEGKVVRKAEELMLEENKMVKRAGTELVCNLLASDRVFEAFSGEEPGDGGAAAPPYAIAAKKEESDAASETRKQKVSPAASKLHILLALSNTFDLPTRLAASACLATLTSSPIACSLLLSRPGGEGKVFELVLELLKPVVDEEDEEAVEEGIEGEVDEGLVHRGLLVLRNLLGHGGKEGQEEARKAGGREVLGGLRGKVGGEVGELVRECLGLMG